MQLNKILVGTTLIALVSFLLVVFISDGITNYSYTGDYSNTSLMKIEETYQTMSNNSNISVQAMQNILTCSGLSCAVDFVGYFFNSGYQALKNIVTSAELTYIIVGVATDETLGGTSFGGNIKGMLIFSVLVIIFVGIILHAVIKSDRL